MVITGKLKLPKFL